MQPHEKFALNFLYVVDFLVKGLLVLVLLAAFGGTFAFLAFCVWMLLAIWLGGTTAFILTLLIAIFIGLWVWADSVAGHRLL